MENYLTLNKKEMVHLQNIGLENFRVFKEQQWFDFAPITILTGTNSSGKSAVINALRLLQDNYRTIKYPSYNSPEEFDLSQLIENDFDSENILERFGNIAQLVNRDSDADSFSFSFQTKGFENSRFKQVDDTFEIRFTISIQGNAAKNGKLTKVEIISRKKSAVVFSLFEKRDNGTYWAARIDLMYYYEIYLDSIKSPLLKYESLEKINERLNSLDSEEDIDAILKEINARLLNSDRLKITKVNGKFILNRFKKDLGWRKYTLKKEQYEFFNYKSLLKVPEAEKLKELILLRYNDKDGLNRLTLEIIKFLSIIEWNDMETADQYWKITDFEFARWKDVPPFSISFILNDFNITHEYINTNDNYISEDPFGKIDDFLNKHYLENEAAMKSIDFEAVKEFFILLINNKKNGELLNSTRTNMYFHGTFLIGHLTQILKPFQNLKFISFLSAQRTLPKRINSLLETDNFTKLVKQLLLLDEKRYKEAIDFINKWVQKFDIGESIGIEKDIDTAQFKFYLNLKDGKKTLLADAGFGVLQIMPLILSAVNSDTTYEFELNDYFYNSKIVVIEEPETNLHPALQSKLADMFVEATKKFNTQFIIETHSEYLIRKLQYLTAKKDSDLKPEDTVIYYFHPPDRVPVGEDQVKKINITEDGSLTDDFGTGFFDEADKIAISLWNMNKTRNN